MGDDRVVGWVDSWDAKDDGRPRIVGFEVEFAAAGSTDPVGEPDAEATGMVELRALAVADDDLIETWVDSGAIVGDSEFVVFAVP
jgi:hypothetical protein